MARELIVRKLCDIHLTKEGEKVEGEELPPFAPDGGKTKVLTLCLDHRAEVAAAFMAAVAEYGIETTKMKKVPKATAPKTSPAAGARRQGQQEVIPEGQGVACELCVRLLGKTPAEVTMKNEDSLSVHRGQRHKVSATDNRLFIHGLHEPTEVDPETGRVTFAKFEWPSIDDETFVIPEYLHCPDCGQGFDPRPKSEQSAWASLTGHRVKQHGYQGAKAA